MVQDGPNLPLAKIWPNQAKIEVRSTMTYGEPTLRHEHAPLLYPVFSY